LCLAIAIVGVAVFSFGYTVFLGKAAVIPWTSRTINHRFTRVFTAGSDVVVVVDEHSGYFGIKDQVRRFVQAGVVMGGGVVLHY
jgi:hypothetical protein